jgi:alpha-maltose-1-phosphate synthase
MSFNVIVSNVAKHHAYETAVAAQKAGMLKRFYTSFFLEKNPPIRHRFLQKILPKSLQSKVSNRSHSELDEKLVKSYYFPEMLERTPLRGIVGRYNMMNFKGSLYDLRVSMNDLKCNIFHGFEGAVLHSMRAAKRQGAVIVLDEPTFYVKTTIAIYREEYSNFGVQPPKWVIKPPLAVKRKYLEIQAADYVFVPSERIRQDFIRYENFDPAKIFVIPYGFSPERFNLMVKQDNTFRVIFVGNISITKGVHYLLQAYKELGLENSELLLIGHADKVAQELILKPFQGGFRHIDHVPNSELNRYYSDSSVFILPSLIEGSALVTYEAMACGLPVIVSENSGSIARDGQDGFVVPIRDIEALKEKILYLYENEQKRQEMGKSAAEYVKQFTWSRYHEAISSAYKSILGEMKNG